MDDITLESNGRYLFSFISDICDFETIDEPSCFLTESTDDIFNWSRLSVRFRKLFWWKKNCLIAHICNTIILEILVSFFFFENHIVKQIIYLD